MDGLTPAGPPAPLPSAVESDLDETTRPAAPAARPAPGLPAAERARYLQLPALSPDIARLAREATAGTRDPETAARRISAFLRTTYRYTPPPPRRTPRPPLRALLCVRRSRH